MSSVRKRKKLRRGGSWLPLILVLVLFAGGLGYGVTKYVIYPKVLGVGSNPSAPAGHLPLTGEAYTDTSLAGEGGSTESGLPPQSSSTTAPPQAVEPSGSPSGTVAGEQPLSPFGTVAGEQPLSQPSADSSPYTGEPQLVYAIQFGSYSTYEGAQKAAAGETAKGREVHIVEKNHSYKVVSSPCSDRREAERMLAALSPEGEDGLFITTMEVLTQ